MSSLLGPSYDYWKSIKQPSEMGMSPGFSLGALATNVDGLLSYVEVLISGTGKASVTGKPLGNKFFLKTTGKCSETSIEKWKKERDEDTEWDRAYEEVENKEGAKQITEDEATKLKNALNEQKKQRDLSREQEKKLVDRWIYVNNIPDGSIPFIASGADGRTFNDLRGLIPGALGNLGALNPVQLFNGFTAGTYPPCAEISLQTVDNDNVSRNEKHHVALVEMVEMNPCMFPGRVNPASGKSCRNSEGFDGMPVSVPGKKNREGNGKEKTPDIYNQQYRLVSENGESIGIYEMGSLAGSSGVAYQTSNRSPLSYNIDITKSSPMTELPFGKFDGRDHKNNGETTEGAKLGDSSTNIDAREVIERHNANVSSFYKEPVTTAGPRADSLSPSASASASASSYYDELIQQLSKILETHDRGGEDLSDISGDTLSQLYYYGITAVLLYLFYRILYVQRK
jgi:hypothetical protein